MRKIKIFCYLMFINVLLIIYNYEQLTRNRHNDQVSIRTIRFASNYEFMINSNVAQYSSYIIVDRDEPNTIIYRIEAYIQLLNFFKNFTTNDKLTCVVKLDNQVIEIEKTASKLNSNVLINKKIYFLDLSRFKSFSFNKTDEILNKLLKIFSRGCLL